MMGLIVAFLSVLLPLVHLVVPVIDFDGHF